MSHNYRLLPCSCLVLGMLAGFAAGTAPARAMDDDLALDMGLDFEEYSAPSADINGSASPAAAPKIAAPDATRQQSAKPAASANSKSGSAPVSKGFSPSTLKSNAARTPESSSSATPKPNPASAAKGSSSSTPKSGLVPDSSSPAASVSGVDLLTKIRKGMDFTTEEMEAWIAQTADLNMCLDNGKTMLLYVVANSSNLDALRLLMEYGADVQTHCTPRYEALFIAAINNPAAEIIEMLINNGANLVEKDHESNTALMLAATFNKSSRVIDTLLEYGLKVDVKNNFGFDALALASYENGNIMVLQSLLDNEADVNAADSEGHTALMAAAVRGRDDVMQYLIKRGADFKAKDKNGLSVLDYYNKRKYLETLGFEINRFATPSERLSAEFKFIAENHHRFNVALKESLFEDNPDAAVADAIANLADIDVLDENGCTTFLNAALYNKSRSVLEKLINGKADVNASCMDGKNALMFISAQAGEADTPALQIEKAKLLLAGGTDINRTDDAGNTALMYALANRADINYIRMLLASGADVNALSNLGETPLWTAVRQNLPSETVKLLIEYGADVNHKDRRGETPLWYLLRTDGDEVLIRTLLRGGADTEVTNAAGDIPLWYVLNKGGSDMVVENIIMAQDNLNIKNEHGDTPLLFALKNNYPSKFVKLLLSRGADPQIRDSDGNNAYDILRNNRYFDAAVQKRTRERVLNSWE